MLRWIEKQGEKFVNGLNEALDEVLLPDWWDAPSEAPTTEAPTPEEPTPAAKKDRDQR